MTLGERLITATLAMVLSSVGSTLSAHDGPPFPIVSDQTAGPYVVSIWTDPDTTDDGTRGGQFWVMLRPVDAGATLPADTRTVVTIAPMERTGPAGSAVADPVDGEPGRQFASLVMDHEGRFSVRLDVDGSLGATSVDSEVEATYDLRPPPAMLLLYLTPFLLAGILWMRLLRRRREQAAARRP